MSAPERWRDNAKGRVPTDRRTDNRLFRDGTSAAGRTGDLELTERGRRLASRDRADHPNAREERCRIMRPHDPHPYGAIHPQGGLRHWCLGRT